MQQWEYKTIKLDTKTSFNANLDTLEFDKMLNELGVSGWEMVSAFDNAYAETVAVFKRQRV